MVDFGGWDMPLAYGSQLEEHHAVRQDAGMFDVSHMLNVDVTGPDAFAFLQRLVANDVAKLTVPGKALYSCMLNPQGGVIDDLIIYFFAADEWRVVVNAGTADKDIAWMQRVRQSGKFDVAIAPRRDLAMIAVQGPNARARSGPRVRLAGRQRTADALRGRPGGRRHAGGPHRLHRRGRLRDRAARHAGRRVVARPGGARRASCGLGARDTLRLEAGMNLYGQDMDELIQPDQAGLTWTVSLKNAERRFIGRDALEQFATPAAFLGLKLQERGVMRAHMAVRAKQGAGELTSGTMSPTLGVSIGFARLPVGVAPGDTVEVDIRGKWVPALVCKLPFVRNGKAVEHS